MTRPSELRIPVGYPNADTSDGAGMSQQDFGPKSLRTVAELRTMDTFRFLEPEFQRAYIAMAAAAWVEAGFLLGVGTGWRSEAIQAANHLRWPNQFAPVSASYHMRKPPRQVAYAIDTVPYDVLGWAHANCARFAINYLDHIPNERHHCQPSVLPNSGTAYNTDPTLYSGLAAIRVNLPYLGFLSLDEWLAADASISLSPLAPEPPALSADTKEVMMSGFNILAKLKTNGSFWAGNGYGRIHVNGVDFNANIIQSAERLVNAADGRLVKVDPTDPRKAWDQVTAIDEDDLDRLLGPWRK